MWVGVGEVGWGGGCVGVGLGKGFVGYVWECYVLVGGGWGCGRGWGGGWGWWGWLVWVVEGLCAGGVVGLCGCGLGVMGGGGLGWVWGDWGLVCGVVGGGFC
uniref:Uncharacterized protein n=1 Tax=Knipowitschia caucasica TaxID=637954 RepID=A0AAV2JYD6_KNICA